MCATGAPYAVLQDAIDNAVSGDTIEVCAGLYDGVTIPPIDLALVGIDGAAATTIRSTTGNGVELGGGSLELTGFTVRSTAGTGASAFLQTAGSSWVHDVVFSYSVAQHTIQLSGGDATWTDVVIEGNDGQGNIVVDLTTGGPYVMRHSTVRDNLNGRTLDIGELTELSNTLLVGNSGPSILETEGFAFNNVVHSNTSTANAYVVAVWDGEFFGNIVSSNSSSGNAVEPGGVSGTQPSADYNDVWDNSGGDSLVGTGNFSADPRFVDPAAQDFSLDPALSPCIDAGVPFDGWNDPDGSPMDLGLFGGPWANGNTPGIPAGSPPADPVGTGTGVYDVCATGAPYTTLQDAVDNALPGEVITVCAGTYDAVVIGTDVELVGEDGAAGTIVQSTTGTAVQVTGGAVTLRDLTIRSTAGGTSWHSYHQTGGQVTLRNIELTGGVGRTVRIDGGDSDWRDVLVDGNDGQASVLFDIASAGQTTITHSRFSNNTNYSLGVYLYSGSIWFSNNAIDGNIGTGDVLSGSALERFVFNNVIYGNQATGAGARCINAIGGDFWGNIVMDNTCTSTTVLTASPGEQMTSFNLLFGNSSGDALDGLGNLSADPWMVDPAAGDFSLDPALSPALDAGHPLAPWGDVDGTRGDIGLHGGPLARP